MYAVGGVVNMNRYVHMMVEWLGLIYVFLSCFLPCLRQSLPELGAHTFVQTASQQALLSAVPCSRIIGVALLAPTFLCGVNSEPQAYAVCIHFTELPSQALSMFYIHSFIHSLISLFECLSPCMQHYCAYLVPREPRKGCQVSWNQSSICRVDAGN